MSLAYGLLTNYDLTAKIGVSSTGTPPTWTYADLGDGLDNITENLNEAVQQYSFLNDSGFARNHITGMAPSYTFTGKRVFGDTAQDYIFGLKYKIDGDRHSSFQLAYTDGTTTTTMTCDCTICNIQELGGGAAEDSSISFEIRLDGEPTVATA